MNRLALIASLIVSGAAAAGPVVQVAAWTAEGCDADPEPSTTAVEPLFHETIDEVRSVLTVEVPPSDACVTPIVQVYALGDAIVSIQCAASTDLVVSRSTTPYADRGTPPVLFEDGVVMLLPWGSGSSPYHTVRVALSQPDARLPTTCEVEVGPQHR